MFGKEFKLPPDKLSRLRTYLKIKPSNAPSPYSPSWLWQKWARNISCTIEDGIVHTSSGHAFGCSKDRRNELLKCFYPLYPKTEITHAYLTHNPTSYLCYLELASKLGDTCDEKVLEIGAGTGISLVTLRWTKAYIVELPNTLPITFVSLSILYPALNVQLPNERLDNPDICLFENSSLTVLPEQVDLALNYSSFQEMEVPTVNAYIRFVHTNLKDKGKLVMANQAVSSNLKYDTLSEYDLSSFSSVTTQELPFASKIHRTKIVMVVATK